MILVDTSLWIDHLRQGDTTLTSLLELGEVATHPLVIGELAIGSIQRRAEFLSLMRELPCLSEASGDEVLAFIHARAIYGTGLGIVDAHLLASVFLTPGASLWTRDTRLAEAAASMSIAWAGP